MASDRHLKLEMRDVVLAVIVREKRVLIARRRATDPFGGFWEFPGGKRMEGESFLDCLHREIREELGVPVIADHFFPPITHAYADKVVRLLPIACHIEGSADPQPLAADCLEWVTAMVLPSHDFPPANGPLIGTIVEYLLSLKP